MKRIALISIPILIGFLFTGIALAQDPIIFPAKGQSQEQLEKDRQELFNLRFQAATQQLENPRRVREVRKNVARILTILSQRGFKEAG